jgi:hypothetical protein
MIGEIIFTTSLAALVAIIDFALVVLSSRIERRQPTMALRQIFSLSEGGAFKLSGTICRLLRCFLIRTN